MSTTEGSGPNARGELPGTTSDSPGTGTTPLGTSAERGPCLARAAIDAAVRVRRLSLPADEAAWRSAVGVAEGEVLTVLRRAPFGGPLHVASSLGGELAIGLALAENILVEATP